MRPCCIIPLLIFISIGSTARDRVGSVRGVLDHVAGAAEAVDTFPIPSPEEFVNGVFHTVVDSSFSDYYLIAGTDTCRFVKYDYDEWAKYTLQESVSIVVLNELAQKVYLSPEPYFWKHDQLEKALLITRKKADSVIFFIRELPKSLTPKQQDKEIRKQTKEWEALPAAKKIVFSFSRPQFTDDGAYAVIDLNFVCGVSCGEGDTYVFRRNATGWKLIAKHMNWSANRN